VWAVASSPSNALGLRGSVLTASTILLKSIHVQWYHHYTQPAITSNPQNSSGQTDRQHYSLCKPQDRVHTKAQTCPLGTGQCSRFVKSLQFLKFTRVSARAQQQRVKDLRKVSKKQSRTHIKCRVHLKSGERRKPEATFIRQGLYCLSSC